MSETSKYDVTQIQKSLRLILDAQTEMDPFDVTEDDPVSLLAIVEELGELASDEDDDDGRVAHFASLATDTQWAKVRHYLAMYYEVKWFTTYLGMCGRREIQDLGEACGNLSALERVVGSWRFLLCEERFADREVKPRYGPERYYEFRWGIKNVPPLPRDAVAHRIGRGVFDCLLKANVPAEIAYFQLEESLRVVIWMPGPVLGTIFFLDDGFQVVSPDFEFPNCTWEHPQFLEILTDVVERLCKTAVPLADLCTEL